VPRSRDVNDWLAAPTKLRIGWIGGDARASGKGAPR